MLLALLLGLTKAANGVGIEVVLSEESGVYLELADALGAELGREKLRRLTAADLERAATEDSAPELVLALGTRALDAALARRSAPVLAALVPAESFDRQLRVVRRPRGAREVSAVYLDQPARRRLALAQLVKPGVRHVGVLASAASDAELRRLREAAASLDLVIVAESPAARGDLYPALKRVLGQADVLLALPDQAHFNTTTIHNILLATYRARVPLLGFSPAYVQAGALAAVYSTPRQFVPQVAEVARRALAGGSLPPPQYPRAFSVTVNATVARSLDIHLPDAADLETRLLALEPRP